jgi:putative ABC transport system substrate-binding protein
MAARDAVVRRRVTVIAAMDSPSALPAKLASTTIPIVFQDPVRLGLVTSLARPGGNLTGVNFFAAELTAKRLELLRELVPAAVRVAVLVNPDNAQITEPTLRDVEATARSMGLQIQIVTEPAANSTPPLRLSRASHPMCSSSAAAPSLMPDVSNWLC